MRKSKIIDFGGEEVTVKELTVAQVVEVVGEMTEYSTHILDVLMDFDMPLSVIVLATGLDEKQLTGEITPTALIPLYEAVVEVNPNLAAMAERLKKIVNKEKI